MNYQYPISHHWETEEIIDVIHFFQSVEAAYEKGILREELMDSYRRFKRVVPGKGEEKRICSEFEEVSGYSSYKAIKKMKEESEGTKVRMP